MARNIEVKLTRILKLISEYGYLTGKIIVGSCGSRRTGFWYLNLLQELGYVDSFPTYSSGSKAYCLSSKGWVFLAQSGGIRVLKNFTKSDYTPAQFYHTVAGAEVRLIFEQHPWVIDYRPSRVLKYFAVLESGGSGAVKGKQCDAEIVVQTPEKKYLFGVEIELTQKNSEAVAKAFINLSAHRQDLDRVLWLCSSETIIKHMQEVYKRNRQNLTGRPEHFFVLLDEFKTKKFHAEWVDVENRKTAILPSLEMLVGTTQQQEKPVPVGPVEPAVVQPIQETQEPKEPEPIIPQPVGEIPIPQQQPKRRR